MVGMRRVAGVWIPNPNARWTITDTTRKLLKSTVGDALKNGWSSDTLAKEVLANNAFSKARAKMIARTELANADMTGAINGWQVSGLVAKKGWLISNNESTCAVCNGNAAVGEIDLEANFPSGDFATPAHPHCEYDVYPVPYDDMDKIDKGYNPSQPRDEKGRFASHYSSFDTVLQGASDNMHSKTKLWKVDAKLLWHC
jgi:hypothetical protein